MTIYLFLCVFSFTLQNTIRFWAYTSCFKLKVKPWVGYTVYLSVTAFISFIKLYFTAIDQNIMFLGTLLVLIIYFLPFHFLTEGSIRKKLILSIFDQIIIDTVIEFTLYIFFDVFFDYGPDPSVFDYERFMCGIVFCLIAAPIKYIMVKIWNKVNKTDSEKINLFFLIFPLSQMIAYIFFQLERYYAEDLWGIDNLLITSIYFIIVAISDVVYIIFLSDIEKKNRLEREYNALNHTRRLEETRYAAIEEKQIETAKIRHDIKNQLIVIKGLINTGNSEEAAELIKELETDVNASKEKEYCSVPIVNALLFEKEKTCIKEGIDFVSDISISDTGCISKNHLCSIFSNLADNAINECKNLTLGEKKIIIKAAQKNGFISIQCENTAEKNKRGIIRPSESKGYGMKILQDIASRYGGRYKCEIDEGKCFSEVTVNTLGQE